MNEARQCGLRFKSPPDADPDSMINTKAARDKDGRLYDSRSGLGSYYRYGPRKLAELCDEKFSNKPGDSVLIRVPKIHESVLKRIQNNAHPCAPLGIPAARPGRRVAVVEARCHARRRLHPLARIADQGVASGQEELQIHARRARRSHCNAARRLGSFGPCVRATDQSETSARALLSPNRNARQGVKTRRCEDVPLSGIVVQRPSRQVGLVNKQKFKTGGWTRSTEIQRDRTIV